jgi:hypothetical protein
LLDFGAEQDAYYTDKINVYVFDDSTNNIDCGSLLTKEFAGGAASLPPTVAQITTPFCQFQTGGGTLDIGFGTYALLVSALDQSGNRFLHGCATGQTVTAAQPTMKVTLIPIGTPNLPDVPPNCTLASHCAKSNGC